MAFSWKFFNEQDKKSVENLELKVQNIVASHQRIHEVSGVGLIPEEEKELENVLKKYRKKLDAAIELLSEFDAELEGIANNIDERIARESK